jgi:HSP20 family protein
MALIRFQPARELDSFQQEVNRLFGTFFDSQAGAGTVRRARRWVPAVDLVEREDHYVLRADLPGITEEDVKIEVEDDVLTVSGERKSEHEETRDGYRRFERVFGSFSRTLRLPEGVDADAIQADFDNGVLEVRIPKPQEREPHRVAIGVAKREPAIESASGDSE